MNVSALLQVPQLHYFDSSKLKENDTFMLELKTVVAQNPECLKERIEYHKKYPKWSNYKAKDEFFWQYTESFFRDIDNYLSWHHFTTPEEASRALCSEWKGYANMYGEDLIRRAFERVML